jgi:DNA-binding transcriptional ArsR family regulator
LRDPGPIFAALADPTRREMVATLLRDGVTTVPALTAAFPITRQAVAKHLAALDGAGLVERVSDSAHPGREVRYRLAAHALDPAAAWLREAESAWDARLERLKRSVQAPT